MASGIVCQTIVQRPGGAECFMTRHTSGFRLTRMLADSFVGRDCHSVRQRGSIYHFKMRRTLSWFTKSTEASSNCCGVRFPAFAARTSLNGL